MKLLPIAIGTVGFCILAWWSQFGGLGHMQAVQNAIDHATPTPAPTAVVRLEVQIQNRDALSSDSVRVLQRFDAQQRVKASDTVTVPPEFAGNGDIINYAPPSPSSNKKKIVVAPTRDYTVPKSTPKPRGKTDHERHLDNVMQPILRPQPEN
jgi:hypothetical protein